MNFYSKKLTDSLCASWFKTIIVRLSNNVAAIFWEITIYKLISSYYPATYLNVLVFFLIRLWLCSAVEIAPGAAAPLVAVRMQNSLTAWVTQKMQPSTRTWRLCWGPALAAATRRSAEYRGFGHGRGHGQDEEVKLAGGPWKNGLVVIKQPQHKV